MYVTRWLYDNIVNWWHKPRNYEEQILIWRDETYKHQRHPIIAALMKRKFSLTGKTIEHWVRHVVNWDRKSYWYLCLIFGAPFLAVPLYISAKPDTWCTQLLYVAWKLCQSEMKTTIFINPSVIRGAKLKNQITHLLCLCSKWRISRSEVLNMTSSFQLENWELDRPTCVYLAWVWYKLLHGDHLLINSVSSWLWCHNKKHKFLTLNANLCLSTWIMKHKTTIIQEVLCSGC